MHAPNCHAGIGFSGYTPQVRRIAAERGRYAEQTVIRRGVLMDYRERLACPAMPGRIS